MKGFHILSPKSDQKLLRKRFIHLMLLVFILVVCIIFVIYSKESGFTFRDVEIIELSEYQTVHVQRLVERYRQFSEEIIKYYSDYIKKDIHPEFYDSFAFINSNKIECQMHISSHDDAFIKFFSGENKLTVRLTSLPLQISLLAKYDDPNYADFWKSRPPIPIEKYYEWPSAIVMTNYKASDTGLIFLHGGNYIGYVPKLISQMPYSIVIIIGGKSIFRLDDGEEIVTEYGNFGIFAGNKCFTGTFNRAKRIGESYAKNEIGGMLAKSELFRKAMAHDELKGMAQQIQTNNSKSQVEPSFDYPLWKMHEDIKILKDRAAELGIDIMYVDLLLDAESKQKRYGRLLWFYDNSASFMIQWILIESGLMGLLIFLYYTNLLIKSPFFHYALFRLIGLSAITIGRYCLIFASKPFNYPIEFLIFPTFFLIISILYSSKIEKSIRTCLGLIHQVRDNSAE